MLLFAGILDDLHGLALLPGGNDHGLRLDDARLLRGDFRKRIAQKVGVVHADGGDDLHHCGGDNVGGIQKAAAAHFQRHDVAALFLEIEERQRGLHLKGGGAGQARLLHLLGSGGNGRHMAGERLFFDVLPVHLNALPVGKQRGRDVTTGTVARTGQDRGKIRQNRSFSVGTGNVDELQLVLRIAQTTQQFSHALQAKHTSVFGNFVQIYSCFYVIHTAPYQRRSAVSECSRDVLYSRCRIPAIISCIFPPFIFKNIIEYG